MEIVTRLLVAVASLMPGWLASDSQPSSVGLAEVRHVFVTSFDGTVLEGWIGMPKVGPGTRVPVALSSSPYLGSCNIRPETLVLGTSACVSSPDDPNFWSESGQAPNVGTSGGFPLQGWGVPPLELVRHGYAAAFFSVRGTGNSGGCFEFGGRSEQRDHAFLVEWLAAQPWSTGRVGMGGLSYAAYTTWQAAVAAPPALKTVVTTGIVSDLYTWFHSPQGAAIGYAAIGAALPYSTSVSLIPPAGGGAAHATIGHLPVLPERVCTEVVRTFASPTLGTTSNVRDAAYYEDRRLIDRFDDVTAAVLLAQGFDDIVGHTYQESAAWRALTQAPKRQIEGRWAHAWPIPEQAPGVRLDPAWRNDKWGDVVFEWLDYWLKNVGETPEHLGRIDYQDTQGAWHSSSQWPPAEARDEVLYLGGRALRSSPGGSARRFRSAPTAALEPGNAAFFGAPFDTWPLLCGAAEAERFGAVYLGPQLKEPAIVAGNPFAYLHLSSDAPGGLVSVHVLDLGPRFDCAHPDAKVDVQVVTHGTADLRFHNGNLRAIDFPVARPTGVRVDLRDNTYKLRAGSRLAVIVSYGETLPAAGSYGQPFAPLVKLHSQGVGASQVVLPVVTGSLGGSAPAMSYPPRPFIPASEPR
jgi:uncharacterized protein